MTPVTLKEQSSSTAASIKTYISNLELPNALFYFIENNGGWSTEFSSEVFFSLRERMHQQSSDSGNPNICPNCQSDTVSIEAPEHSECDPEFVTQSAQCSSCCHHWDNMYLFSGQEEC